MMLLRSLLVVSLLELINVSAEKGVARKVWSDCTNGACSCGNDVHRTVLCSTDFVMIRPCYCMYYDQEYNASLLGRCLSSCFYTKFNDSIGELYYQIKRFPVNNSTVFNDFVCNIQFFHKNTNREGRFCGRCKEGYGLAVYSYHYTSCIPCTDYGYKNWLRYFAVALLPLTLFYFLVVVFRINVTSSYLNGIVLTVQCILSPIQLRVFDAWIHAANSGTPNSLLHVTNFATSFCGMLNLDFFRTLYPHFCLHPKLNILHVASLDFIVALYPFVLILLTYFLVTMYDSNYRVIVWAWKPFKRCLKYYQRQFSAKSSLIETFATFILLSNVKILGVCFDLLQAISVNKESGSTLGRYFSYYDANIEYFGSEHLPYAVLALFIGFMFVVLPFLLLVVYPCSCFQKCLNLLGWRCQVLHIFMDAFQGNYKTEPHNLRYFSAFHLLVRFLLLLSTSYIASAFFVPVSAFVMILSSFVFAAFQPYKNSFHNKVDTGLMLLMALFYVGVSADIMGSSIDYNWLPTAQVLFAASLFLLLSYILTVFIFRPLCSKVKTFCSKPRNDADELRYFERKYVNSYSPLLQMRN